MAGGVGPFLSLTPICTRITNLYRYRPTHTHDTSHLYSILRSHATATLRQAIGLGDESQVFFVAIHDDVFRCDNMETWMSVFLYEKNGKLKVRLQAFGAGRLHLCRCLPQHQRSSSIFSSAEEDISYTMYHRHRYTHYLLNRIGRVHSSFAPWTSLASQPVSIISTLSIFAHFLRNIVRSTEISWAII